MGYPNSRDRLPPNAFWERHRQRVVDEGVHLQAGQPTIVDEQEKAADRLAVRTDHRALDWNGAARRGRRRTVRYVEANGPAPAGAAWGRARLTGLYAQFVHAEELEAEE